MHFFFLFSNNIIHAIIRFSYLKIVVWKKCRIDICLSVVLTLYGASNNASISKSSAIFISLRLVLILFPLQKNFCVLCRCCFAIAKCLDFSSQWIVYKKSWKSRFTHRLLHFVFLFFLLFVSLKYTESLLFTFCCDRINGEIDAK